MHRPLLRQNFANASMYFLGALSLMLLMSCAHPYSPAGLSSPVQAITDVLNNPALAITGKPVFLILIWLFGIAVQSGLLKVIGPPKKNRRAAHCRWNPADCRAAASHNPGLNYV
jgi:hypothetical protein